MVLVIYVGGTGQERRVDFDQGPGAHTIHQLREENCRGPQSIK